jgi:hypothetical protein
MTLPERERDAADDLLRALWTDFGYEPAAIMLALRSQDRTLLAAIAGHNRTARVLLEELDHPNETLDGVIGSLPITLDPDAIILLKEALMQETVSIGTAPGPGPALLTEPAPRPLPVPLPASLPLPGPDPLPEPLPAPLPLPLPGLEPLPEPVQEPAPGPVQVPVQELALGPVQVPVQADGSSWFWRFGVSIGGALVGGAGWGCVNLVVTPRGKIGPVAKEPSAKSCWICSCVAWVTRKICGPV